jgi:hypothetical protein
MLRCAQGPSGLKSRSGFIPNYATAEFLADYDYELAVSYNDKALAFLWLQVR